MTMLDLNDIFQKKKVIQATRDGLFCISCFTRLILNKEYYGIFILANDKTWSVSQNTLIMRNQPAERNLVGFFFRMLVLITLYRF